MFFFWWVEFRVERVSIEFSTSSIEYALVTSIAAAWVCVSWIVSTIESSRLALLMRDYMRAGEAEARVHQSKGHGSTELADLMYRQLQASVKEDLQQHRAHTPTPQFR